MLPVFRTTSVPASRGSINRLESLFQSLYDGDDANPRAQAWAQFPMTIWADDDQYHVEAELPGVAEADIEVTVHNDTLIIRGERKPEEGRHYLYNSRWFGKFERVFSLPEAVQADSTEARLIDGVLHIDLPKRPEAKPKRINLKTS